MLQETVVDQHKNKVTCIRLPLKHLQGIDSWSSFY